MPTIQELFAALLRDVAGAQRAADDYWRQTASSATSDRAALVRSTGPVIREVEFEIKCAVARMDRVPLDPAEGFGPETEAMTQLVNRIASHFAHGIAEGVGHISKRDLSHDTVAVLRQNLLGAEFIDALAQRMLASMLELFKERGGAQRRISPTDVVRRCRSVVETDVMQQEGLASPATSAGDRKDLLQRAEASAQRLGEQVVAALDRLRGATNQAMELLVTVDELGALPAGAVSSMRITVHVPSDTLPPSD